MTISEKTVVAMVEKHRGDGRSINRIWNLIDRADNSDALFSVFYVTLFGSATTQWVSVLR